MRRLLLRFPSSTICFVARWPLAPAPSSTPATSPGSEAFLAGDSTRRRSTQGPPVEESGGAGRVGGVARVATGGDLLGEPRRSLKEQGEHHGAAEGPVQPMGAGRHGEEIERTPQGELREVVGVARIAKEPRGTKLLPHRLA